MGSLKKIIIPELNEELAELVGVLLGDGTLTKYYFRIFGDSRYDKLYFQYLSKLINNLFGINSNLTVDKRSNNKRNTLILCLSSRTTCNFLHIEYNLPYGDKIKGHAKIPECILKDSNLIKSCIRGLIEACLGGIIIFVWYLILIILF